MFADAFAPTVSSQPRTSPGEAGMRTSTCTLAAALAAGMIASAGAADEPDPPALARQALDVLKANCHRCHGQDGANEGGFNYVLDAARLVARKKVLPGDPAKS